MARRNRRQRQPARTAPTPAASRTTVDVELELKQLLHELYVTYTGTDAPGHLSLLDRLGNAYLYQLGQSEPSGRRTPPGPRPPGRDGAMLAADEIERAIGWWVLFLAPGDHDMASQRVADLLPTLAVQSHGGQYADQVTREVRGNHRTALLVLGLTERPKQWRGDGTACPACGRQSIVFSGDHPQSMRLWCSRGGYEPDACHDDGRWPECRDESGVITCRRSPRSVRHSHQWGAEDLHELKKYTRAEDHA